MWNTYDYSKVYRNLFTKLECRSIVDLHMDVPLIHSHMNHLGSTIRDSRLYWLDVELHSWIGDRLKSTIQDYNKEYNFEINDKLLGAQLTAYFPGQFYEWHQDLGPGPASYRKISMVVELLHSDDLIGGGLDVFCSPTILEVGDAILFPSWISHRAIRVAAGVRWSLVNWILGPHPFR